MSRLNDLTGKTIGRWTVLRRNDPPSRGHRPLYVCRCSCGTERVVQGNHLTEGRTKSCGCLRTETSRSKATTHGHYGERLYVVWKHIKERCYSPTCKEFRYYGGRGISICDDWKNNYLSFRKWAYENGYDESADRGKCTLDRIDNDGNYEPGNCRWTDMATQCKNKRPWGSQRADNAEAAYSFFVGE